MKGRTPLFVPCTPKGCMVLLERSGVQIAGKNAVVLGRSNIVGVPAAMLLLQRNATVTIVHSRTKNPEEIVRQADIVVAACGRTEMVKVGLPSWKTETLSTISSYPAPLSCMPFVFVHTQGSWLKPGCVVIDVGINTKEDASRKRGYRLVGDVDYAEARKGAQGVVLSGSPEADVSVEC